ncbi:MULTISPECIES: hypothetical protein [unclassified Streptomyces]|uniref:hypothetical protein n=1 Tax=unclassified Streptomyces TaxID=2593676 RepID=UPI0016610E02|nr:MULTISPECIES: hypothetical protein [unclassified Streptomyces]MBD0712316.1 hypothetical protein [Streptomyces sp. CBMA291]MBD0716690.1 hypothetical protein [Streptomyces sp. CBMA370]
MCNDGANAEETATQSLYGCWPDLFNWVWQAYALTDDSWNPAGISDACNVTLPFGKVVNSAYLINYCLTDNYNSQWHSTEDYQSSSRAADNRFHGPFYQRFIQYNGSSEADSETGRFAARDRTNLHCPLFNLGSPSDSAGNRASVMLHESWHHWQYKHNFQTGHIGGCSNGQCDYYYFHGVSAYEFGQFDRYDTNPGHLLFHSPYQVCAELEGDLAENAKPFVPAVVTQAARNIGNLRLANCFANAVGYRIGDPRPW